IRMPGRASDSAEDSVVVTVAQVTQRVDTTPARSSSSGGEQQQWLVGEVAPDPTLVCAEFGDYLAVLDIPIALHQRALPRSSVRRRRGCSAKDPTGILVSYLTNNSVVVTSLMSTV